MCSSWDHVWVWFTGVIFGGAIVMINRHWNFFDWVEKYYNKEIEYEMVK